MNELSDRRLWESMTAWPAARRFVGLFPWLFDVPATGKVHVMDGFIQTKSHAATPR